MSKGPTIRQRIAEALLDLAADPKTKHPNKMRALVTAAAVLGRKKEPKLPKPKKQKRKKKDVLGLRAI